MEGGDDEVGERKGGGGRVVVEEREDGDEVGAVVFVVGLMVDHYAGLMVGGVGDGSHADLVSGGER